jgi:hypothetical protein
LPAAYLDDTGTRNSNSSPEKSNEFRVRGGYLILDVLNGTPSFDAADGKTIAVGEAGYDSGLEFEGTDEGFVDTIWLSEVDDGNMSVCCADDEELILGVH